MKYWTVKQKFIGGRKAPVIHWVRDNIRSRAACGFQVRDRSAWWDGAEITCAECRRLYEEAGK